MVKKLLLAFVLVLATLYVAADFGARALADAGVSKELQSSLRLSTRPDVSLGGFPFIPKLVSGHFDTVTATARGFSVGGVRFARVDLTLHDVKTSTWHVLRGADTKIAVGGGEGTATMTAADASAALKDAGFPIEVKFEGGKVRVHAVRVSGPSGTSFVVTPTIRHGVLILLGLGNFGGPVRLPLPDVVPGLLYTGVKVVGSRAELSFDVRKATLRIA